MVRTNETIDKFDESIANIDRLLLKDLSKEQLIEKVIEIDNKNMKLTVEKQQLKDELEWYKQQCDDLEMQIGCMSNE